MTESTRGIEAKYKVHVTTGRSGQKKVRRGPWRRPPKSAQARGPSRLARLLALAHHFDDMIRDGVVKDQAEIARLMRVTRARVTQVMTLLLLAPDLQAEILGEAAETKSGSAPSERQARGIALIAEWAQQEQAWRALTAGGAVSR